MRYRYRQFLLVALAVAVCAGIAICVYASTGGNIAILSPAGPIAGQQRDLLVIATLLMLLVVVPVFFLIFSIAWKYRATNTKATYQPEWDSDNKLEAIWWGFPLLIIGILAVFAWTSTHNLEPGKALASDKKPLTVQVVALQWKWLFLYPEERVASVNYVNFPADRPVEFHITADAPMNSFWIPRLGGQIYAMSGMTTRLNLMADQPGSYHGTSANLSGSGFADMNFIAESSTEQQFKDWVADTRANQQQLTYASYASLARPKAADGAANFGGYEPGLYQAIIDSYNAPVSDGAQARKSLSEPTSRRLLNE